MSRARRPATPALDRLATHERAQLLDEMLLAHPELVDETERRARTRLARLEAGEVEAAIARAILDADVGQLAHRAGRVPGRGYVDVGEAAGEVLEELLQPALDDLGRRAALGFPDAAAQIGLGLLRGLAACRGAVREGTVLAYAGEDATDDLAWSVLAALARAGVILADSALSGLPVGWREGLDH